MAESKPEPRLTGDPRIDEPISRVRAVMYRDDACKQLVPSDLRQVICRYDDLARENEELRAEIANFDAIRAQDRAVGVLLVELAGHLGVTCEVNSESILRRAIEYVRREEAGRHA